MKRFLCFALCFGFCLALMGCGGTPASQGPKDYPGILEAARTEDENTSHVIFHYKDGAYFAAGAYSADLTQDQVDTQGLLCLQMLGLEPADVAEAAFSVSLMNIESYGVAIVSPASGKTDTIKQGLSDFIEGQKAAQLNYLPDQYAIASAARLETLKTGQVVLAMGENQTQVYDNIKNALK